jgi:hypothetical protein
MLWLWLSLPHGAHHHITFNAQVQTHCHPGSNTRVHQDPSSGSNQVSDLLQLFAPTHDALVNLAVWFTSASRHILPASQLLALATGHTLLWMRLKAATLQAELTAGRLVHAGAVAPPAELVQAGCHEFVSRWDTGSRWDSARSRSRGPDSYRHRELDERGLRAAMGPGPGPEVPTASVFIKVHTGGIRGSC